MGPGVAESDKKSRSLARPPQAGEAFDGGDHRPPPDAKTAAKLPMRRRIHKARSRVRAWDLRGPGIVFAPPGIMLSPAGLTATRGEVVASKG